jgi:hypothetical protein
MAIAIEILSGIAQSIIPSNNLVGAFLALNVCACIIVFVTQKWNVSSKLSRSSTPDLEKPFSRGREKITRNFGGMQPSQKGSLTCI